MREITNLNPIGERKFRFSIEIYCSFAEKAGNTGCQMMNTAFYYYGLNKI